ncbi:MAG: hypothetical protein ACTFAL_13245 [Candidatus Electronema sp. V4]|uniref:hypothetical protein n=1 Tax=Candidatus Electronema sp. V4 TaxID=3454756 RepID=UPI0040557675
MKGMAIKFAVASALAVITAGAAAAAVSTPQADQSLAAMQQAATSQRLSDLAKLYRDQIKPMQRP